MKGKNIQRQMACLCLMVFLAGMPGLAGASGREEIYGRELDTLYAMVQSGSSYILFGDEREDLMAVWEGVRNLSPAQGLEQLNRRKLPQEPARNGNARQTQTPFQADRKYENPELPEREFF